MLETILLIITYSTILITIFVGVICYKRNIEKIETIAFSISLLLLIVAMTIAHIYENDDVYQPTHILILLSMILVGLTTPLSVMADRKHHISATWIKALYVGTALLFVATCIAYVIGQVTFMEYVVTAFLILSVISSMILARRTEPQESSAHLERSNRIFGIVFMVVVPLSFISNYLLSDSGYDLKVGLVMPIIFTLLAAHKLIDDLQRLSLVNPKRSLDEQHFDNYQLSSRERDVARLLAKGRTYKDISEELFISMPTVKTHASNIYKKCKVSSRHELTLLLTY